MLPLTPPLTPPFLFLPQLGLQFTVPFLSIPLGSLMGQYADWSTMLSVNWPSLLALGLTVLIAAIAVPWLVGQLGGKTNGLPSFLNLSNLGKMTGYGRSDDGQCSTEECGNGQGSRAMNGD